MKRADRIFAFICLGLSGWLILESFRYDYMAGYTPGPGFLPFWLGVSLGLLSLFLVFDTFRRKGRMEEKEPKPMGEKAVLRIGLILLITAGLCFFMTKIGFVLATFVFIALVLIVLERFSIFKGILYGVILSGSILLIFRYWLNVDLPKGWLGL
jgi:putative tricarboxylic transport membrane protein